MSVYANEAEQRGKKVDRKLSKFTMQGLFSTLTNVNFDPSRFRELLFEAQGYEQEVSGRD